jgi:hypothetical protein
MNTNRRGKNMAQSQCHLQSTALGIHMIKPILFISILAIFVVFSVPLAAENATRDIRPPRTIVNQIAEMEGLEKCSSEQPCPLGSKHFLALERDTLLILLELPDYLGDKSNSVIALLADVRGRWLLGDRLPGSPVFFGKGPDNTLWLATQWQIEGTYPSLFQSPDGLHWQEIPLPPGPEPGSPFVFLDNLCFRKNELLIKLTSENGEKIRPSQTYSADWRGLLPKKETWHENPTRKTDESTNCNPIEKTLFDWKRKEQPQAHEIVFYRDNYELIIPAVLSLPPQTKP